MIGARSELELEMVTGPWLAAGVSGSAMGTPWASRRAKRSPSLLRRALSRPNRLLTGLSRGAHSGFCTVPDTGLEHRHVHHTDHASLRGTRRGHQGPPFRLRPYQRTPARPV